MKNVNFAVIGCGLMGREFASVSMRWLHLLGDIPRPVILAACDLNDDNLNWFKKVPDCKYFYHNYQEMLENPEIEAVYCAVPHTCMPRSTAMCPITCMPRSTAM